MTSTCESSREVTFHWHCPASRRHHGTPNAANRVCTPSCLYLHVIVPECPGLRGTLNSVRSSARIADLDQDDRGVGQIRRMRDDVDQPLVEAPMASRRRHRVTLAPPIAPVWGLGRARATALQSGAERSVRAARRSTHAGTPDDLIECGPVDHDLPVFTDTRLIHSSPSGRPCRCENRRT